MPRKVSTGAATPVALGYQDGDDWTSLSANFGNVDTKEGTVAASGDNTLVDAPGAGKRIVVTAFVIQNESATATTMILRAGTSIIGWRFLGQSQGASMVMSFASFREWRLPENTALNLNLSGANSCGYSVSWFVEDI